MKRSALVAPALAVALVLGALAPLHAGDPKGGLDLWLYCPTNLLVDKNVTELAELWKRAAGAGYTKVLLADSKLAKLGDVDARYFKNLEKAKATAAELKLELVPAVFAIGYSNDLLWHDPNLAEGVPVKDALFVVKSGEARLVADPPVDFKEKWDYKDDGVALDGGTAVVRDPKGNARLTQKLQVSKFRCYHISVEIKSDNFGGEPEVKVLDAKGRSLQYQQLGVARTQDWKTHHVVVNSLENDVFHGVFRDLGRGLGHALVAQVEDRGGRVAQRPPPARRAVRRRRQGRGERLRDDFRPPRMGNQPWNGSYEVWHEPPPIKTRLPDGTKLRVSWFHPVILGEEQVGACPAEPKTSELLRDEARRVREATGARGLMMEFDEIRVLGWDESCAKKKKAPGALLADSARECTKLLSGAQAYVWSDMFDPFHNAHDDYYLVHGDLKGSWEGLDKSVVVVNWNFGKRDESLAFFAQRGHKQVIAGYYDGDVKQARDWLASAAKVKGVTGIMYTTWKHRYDDLEAFAKTCRE